MLPNGGTTTFGSEWFSLIASGLLDDRSLVGEAGGIRSSNRSST
jgi:hypothetical protein